MSSLSPSTPTPAATSAPRGSFVAGLAYWTPTISRFVLGGLFLAAGLMKIQDPQSFLFAINGFKLLPPHLAYTMAFVIPCVEIIAGGMLVVGLWSRAAAVVLAGLLFAFILGIVNVLANGYDTKCSCFGEVEWPCPPEVGTCQIVRNCLMMLAAVPVLVWGAGKLSVDHVLERRGTRAQAR
jgi:uncharacterized membrane protein YphA (DoxX/SURF4 family)